MGADDKDKREPLLSATSSGLSAVSGRGAINGDAEADHEVYASTGGTFCFCLPQWFLKFVILTCICFLTFGSYWVYDTPGAIPSQLTAWFGPSFTPSKRLLLYSVYSWPNTVLAFFGGYIVDRLTGVRLGSLLFCGFILLGQGLFSLGIQVKTYWICVAGRFVFGLGGESLTVAQNTYTVRWFEGKVLALCFGLVVAFARVGSSVNFSVTPTLADSSVPFAVWFGTGMCMLSFLVCIILSGLDKWGEKRDMIIQQDSEETISWKHIREFPPPAWSLYGLTMLFYIGVLTFYTVASSIMSNTGAKYSDNTATNFLAIPNYVSIFASPFFGFIVDKVGRALWMIIIACLMMIGAHVGFLANAIGWVEIHPIIILVWLGFAYSLGAACVWPILSLIVPDVCLGTAYGCMTAVQNTGLALFPLVIGTIQDRHGIKGTLKEYTIPIFIFIGCEIAALLLTLVTIGLDKKYTNGKLNSSAAEREVAAKLAEQMAEAQATADKRNKLMQHEHVIDSVPVSPLVRRMDGGGLRTNYLSRLGFVRPKDMFLYRSLSQADFSDVESTTDM